MWLLNICGITKDLLSISSENTVPQLALTRLCFGKKVTAYPEIMVNSEAQYQLFSDLGLMVMEAGGAYQGQKG